MPQVLKTKLKPCPLCGLKVVMNTYYSKGYWICHEESIALRTKCGIVLDLRGDMRGGRAEKSDLIKKWNRRVRHA